MAKRRYLSLTIVEPFPVFFSHVAYPEERRRETAKGPFYAPNFVRLESPTDANRAFQEWQAKGLREAGWTVLLGEVER